MRGVDSDVVYPLGLPGPLKTLVRLLIAAVVICGMALDVSDAAVALIDLLAWRSWQLSERFENAYRGARVRCKCSGAIEILGFDRADYVALSWSRPDRFPGFVAVRFRRSDGKPLEILIFCRYDRRRSYRRVVLELMYHEH
ncbi:MAG: hypothetical protein HKN70_08850 [Gammaproteobacteria bacterium]|nr:hypothetical protein [Gammaproteobacteria bacterium]